MELGTFQYFHFFRGVRLSILAMGLGLARLKEKGLFIDLKYHSMNDKKDVFLKVKEATLREFKEYAKGEETVTPSSKIRVVGNQLFIGKNLAVTLADELDGKTRKYLTDINVKAGEVLYMTSLYDMEELRRFERGAEKMKKEMRVRK